VKIVNVGLDVTRHQLAALIIEGDMQFRVTNDCSGIRTLTGRLSCDKLDRIVVRAPLNRDGGTWR
jgi:hypothetical protein